jgi:hypothetical protein
MRYQAFVRAAAGALATAILGCGAAYAQDAGTQPLPRTMTDTAPLPATERQSSGAVILMDEPVLAQRQAMAELQERAPDTTALGAGPARVFERAELQQRMRARRARELQQERKGTPQ